MAIPKIKATYSLDEPTVRKLEEIARKWETTKSGALSRLINQGASDAEDAEVKRKLEALDDYQRIMNLTPEQVEQWQRESDEIRHSWVNPWDKL
jgi:predicted transcriptional regulator